MIPAGSPPAPIRFAGAKNVILLLGAVAASVFAVEVYLRAVMVTEQACFGYDATLGWDNKLYCTGRLEGSEFDTVIQTNGQHMRESGDFELRGEKVRVAVVGDSFVWGHGVNEEDRLTEGLQERLGSAYEVMNFGVGGFGPGQYFLKVKRDVVRFGPDFLIVVFFVNDFQDIRRDANHLGIPKPRYVLTDRGLELTGVPVPRIAGWDRARDRRLRPRVWQLLERAFGSEDDSDATDGSESDFFNPEHVALIDPARTAELDASIALNGAILTELRDLAVSNDIALLVTEIPYKEYFIPEETLRNRFGFERIDLPFNAPREGLRDTSARLGVAYIDPYPHFEEHGGLRNYFRRDQHLRPGGHDLMADLIYDGLRSTGLAVVDVGADHASYSWSMSSK